MCAVFQTFIFEMQNIILVTFVATCSCQSQRGSTQTCPHEFYIQADQTINVTELESWVHNLKAAIIKSISCEDDLFCILFMTVFTLLMWDEAKSHSHKVREN